MHNYGNQSRGHEKRYFSNLILQFKLLNLHLSQMNLLTKYVKHILHPNASLYIPKTKRILTFYKEKSTSRLSFLLQGTKCFVPETKYIKYSLYSIGYHWYTSKPRSLRLFPNLTELHLPLNNPMFMLSIH